MAARRSSYKPNIGRRRGMTLLEVVAAMAILGGGITSLLLARAAAVTQLQISERELIARHLALELIGEWSASGERIDLTEVGDFEKNQNWHWSRRVVEHVEWEFRPRTIVLTLTHCTATEACDWQREYQWWVKDESNKH